jgi:hypothetical protein
MADAITAQALLDLDPDSFVDLFEVSLLVYCDFMQEKILIIL